MKQDWVEVRIKTELDAGELAGLLNDPGMVGAWQEEDVIHLYWPSERWTTETHCRLTDLIRRISRDTDSLTVHSLPDEDWNLSWARSVVPFRVGRRIVIRPSWQPAPVYPGDVELILDPKQAFGTGHHATTQLMLEWLEAHVRGGEQVLDIGTGSGILAMAALRFGAAFAWGLDHDPIAVECAVEYATCNKFGRELRLDTSHLTEVPSANFDLVLANLDGRTLLEIVTSIPTVLQPHGYLVVSGILSGDREDILEACRRVGGHVSWEQERDGWVAFAWTFQKEQG